MKIDFGDISVNNPLLERLKLPGETFTLPSCGVFYGDGVLDDTVKNAEVRVHPMTAIDEITIKTPDMLFSGDAVREVFKRCIPQILNVNALLSKDVDFLLVCLRKVSYGDNIEISANHTCDETKTHTYQVDTNTFIKSAKRLDPTMVSEMFTVTMPNGQVVKLKPISFENYIKIMQNNNEFDSNNDDSAETRKQKMIESISNIIQSIDDITVNEHIVGWLDKIPPMYANIINSKVENTFNWGSTFSTTVVCKECKEEMTLSAQLNPISFFI